MSLLLTPSTNDGPLTAGRPAARLIKASKTYSTGEAAVTALNDVDVDFAAGQFTAIMGPSGSGKSTMMHCAAGLDRLTSGAAIIGDEDLTELSDKDLTLLRRTQVGFVFQTFNLIPSLTAKENITLPLSLSGTTPRREVLDDVVSMLGLADRMTHRPAELSGGQQQRVAVARALASEPKIIFADEPTGNLDSRSGHEVLSFLRDAVDERQQTIVMVTHDPVAAAWADRVIFIVDGQIHGEQSDPDADSVLGVIRELGR